MLKPVSSSILSLIFMCCTQNVFSQDWIKSNDNIYNYNTGFVGIGTPDPQYKLDVCGNIRAKEIKVESFWCDFVFENTYKLLPLKEVQSYTKLHHHLPNVTPASVIEKEGLEVGKASREMIQKIEELYLYMFQMNERLEKLEKENEALKRENEALKQKN